jgi:hypothetical protein
MLYFICIGFGRRNGYVFYVNKLIFDIFYDYTVLALIFSNLLILFSFLNFLAFFILKDVSILFL